MHHQDEYRVLLVAGSPEATSAKLLAQLSHIVDCIIAVDKGADALLQAKIVPQLFVGDGDSCSDFTKAALKSSGCTFVMFPPEKDYSDLSLAIEAAIQQADHAHKPLRIVLTSASGGRPDHALCVYGVLAQYAQYEPVLVENDFTAYILSEKGRCTFSFSADDIDQEISVVALRDETRVSQYGMKWCQNSALMTPLLDLGLSNVVVSADARIVCESGCIAMFDLRKNV